MIISLYSIDNNYNLFFFQAQPPIIRSAVCHDNFINYILFDIFLNRNYYILRHFSLNCEQSKKETFLFCFVQKQDHAKFCHELHLLCSPFRQKFRWIVNLSFRSFRVGTRPSKCMASLAGSKISSVSNTTAGIQPSRRNTHKT